MGRIHAETEVTAMAEENVLGSRDVAKAVVRLAMTMTREEEIAEKEAIGEKGIRIAAADFGGEFVTSIMKMVERAVTIAKKEGMIDSTLHSEGAVAGAAHEALEQVSAKALGLNIGGKIAVARYREHVAVAVFFGVGLGHLDEVCIGLGHRVV